MVKTNDADCEEAQVDESPEEMDCDDAADIYIMMQCLFVTKNEHFLLGVSCNHLNPP